MTKICKLKQLVVKTYNFQFKTTTHKKFYQRKQIYADRQGKTIKKTYINYSLVILTLKKYLGGDVADCKYWISGVRTCM